MAGRTDDAVQVLDELSRRAKDEYIAPLCLAQIYSGLEDVESGLEWWQKALEEKNGASVISANQSLRLLVADPRGRALLGELGVPKTE
jgi:predicted Zn-dependent protease